MCQDDCPAPSPSEGEEEEELPELPPDVPTAWLGLAEQAHDLQLLQAGRTPAAERLPAVTDGYD